MDAPPLKKKKVQLSAPLPGGHCLVFAYCRFDTRYFGDNEVCLELDAPMLQYFKYKGDIHLHHHLR